MREYARRAVYFQERKYFIRNREQAAPPFSWRYELAPWTAGITQASMDFIVYDADYVAKREAAARTHRKHDRWHASLVCFYPFMGFCWSGFKERVLGPLGFEPMSITSASALLGFSFFALEGIFILYFGGGFLEFLFSGWFLYYLGVRAHLFWLDLFCFLVLPLDCMIRFGQVIEGGSTPDGFLEWAWKWLIKKRLK